MIIDVNVSIGTWPFRNDIGNNPAKLSVHLEKNNIDRAYVRSCSAAFLPEPETDNQNLVLQLQDYPRLIPLPTINPTLPGWQSMADFSHTRAINIYPNYHSYELNDNIMHELAKLSINSDTILFITMRMQDSRTSFPHCIVPDVSAEAVNQLAVDFPELKIICLNSSFPEAAILTKDRDNVYIDIAYCENGDTLHNLIETMPEKQIIFGSHTPFLTTQASIMKLEYATIPDTTRTAISHINIDKSRLKIMA